MCEDACMGMQAWYLVVWGPAVDGACACVCSSSSEAGCASACIARGA